MVEVPLQLAQYLLLAISFEDLNRLVLAIEIPLKKFSWEDHLLDVR